VQDITLQQLLEAGCHFGHKSERWHPHAAAFIYTEKDGIHIIDLAKTRDGLIAAGAFIRDSAAAGNDVLFVATKRQAQGVVKEAAKAVGAPFFTERWIGGFLTNWEEIKKNINKANKMEEDQASGAWKKFPKHEQMKMAHHLERLKMFYEGVLTTKAPPKVMFVVDVRKEISAVREAIRCDVPIVAIVDTNSDPKHISHVIPANDDAVGSIQLITNYIAQAYAEGKKLRVEEKPKEETSGGEKKEEKKAEEKAIEKKVEKKVEKKEKPAKSVKAKK